MVTNGKQCGAYAKTNKNNKTNEIQASEESREVSFSVVRSQEDPRGPELKF